MLLLLSVAVVVVVFFWGGGGDTNHVVIKLLCVADGIPAGQVCIRSLNPLLLRAAGKVTALTVAATASCVVHQFVLWADGGKRAGGVGEEMGWGKGRREADAQPKHNMVAQGTCATEWTDIVEGKTKIDPSGVDSPRPSRHGRTDHPATARLCSGTVPVLKMFQVQGRGDREEVRQDDASTWPPPHQDFLEGAIVAVGSRWHEHSRCHWRATKPA